MPPEVAFPWLRDLTYGNDHEDAADAVCALAFRGDNAAIALFENLPPTGVNCRRIVDTAAEHDELARAGERAYLRSYRCIEVMDCRPYFFRHAWAFWRGGYAGDMPSFPWADALRRAERETLTARAEQLLPAWMRHFPGHPGSDDMCYRLALMANKWSEYLKAAEWASIGATEPDQDMKHASTALLLSLAEFHLSPYEFDALIAGRAFERNRQLIQYTRLRRTAVEEGFAAALLLADDIAGREPDSVLGVSFRARWSADPACGLKSGATPLPDNDPLRLKSGPEVEWQGLVNPASRWGRGPYSANDKRSLEERRLRPMMESVQLPTYRLAWQFRFWETQAELMRRRDSTGGDALADLEYKIGAVFYHSPWVLFPVYATQLRNSGLPDPRSGSGLWTWSDDQKSRMREFREGAASWAQAARQFERLADEHPRWDLRDRALYSAAVARIKLADNWPFAPTAPLTEYIPEGVRLFERVSSEHPQSSLAASASAAAEYWRRNHKHLFN